MQVSMQYYLESGQACHFTSPNRTTSWVDAGQEERLSLAISLSPDLQAGPLGKGDPASTEKLQVMMGKACPGCTMVQCRRGGVHARSWPTRSSAICPSILRSKCSRLKPLPGYRNMKYLTEKRKDPYGLMVMILRDSVQLATCGSISQLCPWTRRIINLMSSECQVALLISYAFVYCQEL